MLLLATGVFGLSFFAYGVALLPFLLVLFLFGVALGVVGSGVVLRLGPAAEWFVWPIPALVSPFVGAAEGTGHLFARNWMICADRKSDPSGATRGECHG